MNIKNKTEELFKSFSDYVDRGGEWYSYFMDWKAISMGITTELENDNKSRYFEARIRWCYSTSTTIKENFEYSKEGFVKACEWLDEMRIKFAEELL